MNRKGFDFIAFADDGIAFSNGSSKELKLAVEKAASEGGLELKERKCNVIKEEKKETPFKFEGLHINNRKKKLCIITRGEKKRKKVSWNLTDKILAKEFEQREPDLELKKNVYERRKL
jgi:hypothetical protein